MGTAEYILADGSISSGDIFKGAIEWLGSQKEIEIISSTNDMALIGMELLYEAKTILHPKKNILSIERMEI